MDELLSDAHEEDMINSEAWQEVGNKRIGSSKRASKNKNTGILAVGGGQRNLRSMSRKGTGSHG